MEQSNLYVYFAFTNDNFDPTIITRELGIDPTDAWRIGESGRYRQQQEYSCWQVSSTGKEIFDIAKLVEEVVNQLADKIQQINKLKAQYSLDTVLEIVMYVDINEGQSTPFLGHSLKVIEFLHSTGTKTDLDLYRYNTAQLP